MAVQAILQTLIQPVMTIKFVQPTYAVSLSATAVGQSL